MLHYSNYDHAISRLALQTILMISTVNIANISSFCNSLAISLFPRQYNHMRSIILSFLLSSVVRAELCIFTDGELFLNLHLYVSCFYFKIA